MKNIAICRGDLPTTRLIRYGVALQIARYHDFDFGREMLYSPEEKHRIIKYGIEDCLYAIHQELFGNLHRELMELRHAVLANRNSIPDMEIDKKFMEIIERLEMRNTFKEEILKIKEHHSNR